MKAIEIVDLSFRRAPRGVEVLSKVSLDLDHGEMVAILGPNGAGKSTLVLCLLGLQPRQRGSIRLNGEDIGRLSRAEMAKRIPALLRRQHCVCLLARTGRATGVPT